MVGSVDTGDIERLQRMQRDPRDSFERFYYEKVGLGEACGCAEMVIRTREIDQELNANGGITEAQYADMPAGAFTRLIHALLRPFRRAPAAGR